MPRLSPPGAFLLCLAVASVACSKAEEPPGTPIILASSVDAVSPPRVPTSARADPDLSPGARRREPDESPPQEAPPDDPAPTTPANDDAPRTQIGTFQDWVKAYAGSWEPDRTPPPRLGVMADLTALAASTLVYCRSGHLISVSLPSGKERQLSSGVFYDASPRWTRDGQHLFFRSTRDGAKERIFRQRFPDGKAEPVTRALRSRSYGLPWAVSDDGALVAYINEQQESDQWVTLVDVATGKEEQIFQGEYPDDLSFSRDRRRLFVVVGGVMHQRIVSVDLATRKATPLPSLGHDEIDDPTELPDGRLFFVSSKGFSMADRDPGLFTMPAGGGAWTRLGTFSAPIGYLQGTISPDGKKIAARWARRLGGFGADWHADVALLSADGGFVRNLSSAFPRPFYSLDSASWANDSRHLAAVQVICPYIGCEPQMNSVVVIDTSSKDAKLVFVGHGTQPVFRPGGA